MTDVVELAPCAACPDVFVVDDGWGGLCPSCCALRDEHAAGRHDARVVHACLSCLAGGPTSVEVRRLSA
ncbi:MAG: hypothetical protein Q7T56_12270 [Nocardioidaceae bacterium]|nr:hypothetical protein [Nocardioidaceae bacterium]